MENIQNAKPTVIQKALAWSVHLFTASGLIPAFMSILAIQEKDWKMAMVWLLLSTFIDSVDGAFARLFRVKEVLPYMDGKTIDYVIDFATYAIIPVFFFYQAELVPEVWRLPCCFTMLLVAAIYYGMEGMVSDDMYFIGFPVLWNWVVFFMLFVFSFPLWLNTVFIFVFAAMHFIPIKFAYPSQATRFKTISIAMAVLFLFGILAFIYYYPAKPAWAYWTCVFIIVYYGGLAVYETWIVKFLNRRS